MADNLERREPLPQALRAHPGHNVRDGFRSLLQLHPSIMKNVTQTFLDSPNLTPAQIAEYEDLMKGINLYEWNQRALQRGLHDTAKYEYMPEFMDEFSKTHSSLARRQIEAEYSNLFDEKADQINWIRPYDFNDFYDRLKERLDTNANIRGDRLDTHARGDRLDRTRGDRLDIQTQRGNLGIRMPLEMMGETATSEANGSHGVVKAPGLSRQVPKPGKFNDLVRALLDLERRQKSRSYGGPR
jgi:hypothetical protein